MTKRILIVGMGMIGSHLIKNIFHISKNLDILDIIENEITLCDYDIVEVENYSLGQDYSDTDIGNNKIISLKKKYKALFNYKNEKLINQEQLKEYDIIISCVDNDTTRKLIIDYCFKTNKEFLDLRATDNSIACVPKLNNIQSNYKFIDEKDTNTYSCIEDRKNINIGGIISASIGLQMLINLLRNKKNKPIILTI